MAEQRGERHHKRWMLSLLSPPIKKTPSLSPYLCRQVHRGARPGVPSPGDVHRPVRLLLMLVVVVCTRSLRRVVPGGRRRSGAGRVITSPSSSSLAVSRPAADERRPESVAPETSPSEAAVAPAGPRGPAKGGEAVSEGLEAVAEVGLRGHGFLGWGVGERIVRLSQRVAELLFFRASSSPPKTLCSKQIFFVFQRTPRNSAV